MIHMFFWQYQSKCSFKVDLEYKNSKYIENKKIEYFFNVLDLIDLIFLTILISVSYLLM